MSNSLRAGVATNQPPDLPLSKLRGIPAEYRQLLKARRITSCEQLLEAAGAPERRQALASATGIMPDHLLIVVQRADLARVNGVGAIFGMMLEDLGVPDVRSLAEQDAAALHERLRRYNQEERVARRAPTPEEVETWVTQAKALPVLLR